MKRMIEVGFCAEMPRFIINVGKELNIHVPTKFICLCTNRYSAFVVGYFFGVFTLFASIDGSLVSFVVFEFVFLFVPMCNYLLRKIVRVFGGQHCLWGIFRRKNSLQAENELKDNDCNIIHNG